MSHMLDFLRKKGGKLNKIFVFIVTIAYLVFLSLQ